MMHTMVPDLTDACEAAADAYAEEAALHEEPLDWEVVFSHEEMVAEFVAVVEERQNAAVQHMIDNIP